MQRQECCVPCATASMPIVQRIRPLIRQAFAAGSTGHCRDDIQRSCICSCCIDPGTLPHNSRLGTLLQAVMATVDGRLPFTCQPADTTSRSWTTCADAALTCSWAWTHSHPSPQSTTASGGRASNGSISYSIDLDCPFKKWNRVGHCVGSRFGLTIRTGIWLRRTRLPAHP